MRNSKRLLALAVSAAVAAPMSAFATNGMNLEGYGPIATGMGGASMAYDNGTAAVMNNPATLGLMDEGSRLDVALGMLGPEVEVDADGSPASWDSSANSFFMPAVGWVKSNGEYTYGFGLFAQGGMGTEYDESGPYGAAPGSAMSAPQMAANIAVIDAYTADPSINGHISADQAMGGTTTLTDYANQFAADVSSVSEYSEVSVGRLAVPFTRKMGKLTVGGSVDFVWAGMDLQMVMSGAMMSDMMMGTQEAGTIDGSLIDAMGGMFFDPLVNNFDSSGGAPTQADFGISGLNAGYFDFKDGSDYTGEAKGYGYAGKIGFTYQVNPKLSIGGTYHSKTSLGDMETDNANVQMSVLMTTYDTNTGNLITMPTDVEMKGTLKVKDFQWPETIGLGASYQVNDRLMLAGDVKMIQWADVMKDFTMSFDADTIEMGGADVTAMFGGNTDMEASMLQEWDDQTVIAIGGSYMVSDATVVRLGYNHASNPIPNKRLHYLFPAIQETHYTFGVGHAFSDADSVNFSMTYAPATTADMGDAAEVTMSQMNWQMMYSHNF